MATASSSTTQSPKALVLLALIVVLGVAGRVVRDQAHDRGKAPRGDDTARVTQLTRAQRAAAAPRGARKAGKGAPKRGGAKRDSVTVKGTGAAPRMRVEQTPVGAMDPAFLAREQRSASVPGDRPGAAGGGKRGTAAPGGGSRQRSGRGGSAPPRPSPPPIGSPEGAVVDLDVASAEEIDRLPRIGPSLAKRIVADRAAYGPFGSLQGLQRVRGIGPALARQLEGRVTFGGSGRPSIATPSPR